MSGGGAAAEEEADADAERRVQSGKQEPCIVMWGNILSAQFNFLFFVLGRYSMSMCIPNNFPYSIWSSVTLYIYIYIYVTLYI